MSNKPYPPPHWAVATTIALGTAFFATTGSANPLDPTAHSGNPSYQSDLATPVAPLDMTLPWRERFTASGAFDERFLRETAAASPSGSAPATTPAAPIDADVTLESIDALDARGIIRDIRVDAGKLKIEHGPIDRHGMPPMTMVFNVADPAMIEGVSVEDEIEFNVDMDAAGFTVTRIRRSGESQ